MLVQAGGSACEWVLARRYCAYQWFDAGRVPAARRPAFVRTAVERWAPFADAQTHVEWHGARAMVWAWSQAGIALPDDTLAVPRRVLPESVLTGAPQVEGSELIALDEGVEGRAWREGVLIASRWWAQAPDLGEWNLFRRGAGLAPVSQLPAVQVPMALQPWQQGGRASLSELLGRHRALVGNFVLALLVAAFAFPLAGALRLLVAKAAVEREIAAQDASLQAILNAREAAERDAQIVDGLLALRPPQTQIALLDHAAVLLRAPGSLLREWRVPNPDVLEVLIQANNPDLRALVEAMQASGWFSEVTAEVGREAGTVLVRARALREGPADASAGDAQ